MKTGNDKGANGIAVVTGAGRGLGRSLARELIARGCIVAGLGRDKISLAETAEGCAVPDAFHAFDGDVSDYDGLRVVFEKIRRIGPITILINNAATYPHRDFLDETADSFMRVVATNLGGMVACSRFALEEMVGRGEGRIVNVTTFADLAPVPASSAYAVSKGACRIFSRALVADLHDRFPGIIISDWIPGALRTRMGIADGLDTDVAARWGAELALSSDPSYNGTLWERDNEILPPQSMKRRVFDRLLLRRAVRPRTLGM